MVNQDNVTWWWSPADLLIRAEIRSSLFCETVPKIVAFQLANDLLLLNLANDRQLTDRLAIPGTHQ
jgi:hypothetical protein